MRIKVVRVWLATDYSDGVNWRRTTYPMLKVRLRYECLRSQEIKFRNHDAVTAASAVYDDQDRKYKGNLWSYAPDYFYSLARGYPVETTTYFEEPIAGFAFLELDYAAEFLPPGKMYRFRIPADMVEPYKK